MGRLVPQETSKTAASSRRREKIVCALIGGVIGATIGLAGWAFYDSVFWLLAAPLGALMGWSIEDDFVAMWQRDREK